MDNVGTEEDIYFAATCIAEGKLPKSACKLLSSAQLIALPKSSGDVQPIAIGEDYLLPAQTITFQVLCPNTTWRSNRWWI